MMIYQYMSIDSMKTDDSYFEEIQSDVWLMDDHRWSYYIWERFASSEAHKAPRSLVHLDYHWDGVNALNQSEDEKQLRDIKNLDEIYRIVLEGKCIRNDSFIAPAIIRNIINEVHFHCFQSDSTPGLDIELLDKYNSRQTIHSNINTLTTDAPKDSLLNIDLDIFNKSGLWAEGDLWSDSDIIDFIYNCKEIIKTSPLVTIAMSFNYSGSSQDTKHLVKLVVPKILALRGSNLK